MKIKVYLANGACITVDATKMDIGPQDELRLATPGEPTTLLAAPGQWIAAVPEPEAEDTDQP